MSPNRFSVTSTSNAAGPGRAASRTSRRAGGRPRRRGSRASISSTTFRHRRDVARTFALSTLVRRPRRPRASSNASRTTRRISASVYHSVSIADAALGRVALLRRPAEVEAAGQLADDQQVDAVEQLRRSGDASTSAGWTVTGRRFANSPRPPRSANSACSGRTAASGSSQRGPPTAPSRTASHAAAASRSSVAEGRAVRVDRRAADETSSHSNANP